MTNGEFRTTNLVAAIILCFAGATGARAEGKDPLTAQVQPLVLRTRAQAPIPVEVSLDWQGMHLLEGRLEMAMFDGREPLGLYQSPPMALATGAQRYHFTLPGLGGRNISSQLEVNVSFVTAKQTFNFGRYPLGVQGQQGRAFVIGVVQTRGELNPREQKIIQSLRYDRFEPATADTSRRAPATTFARLMPEDLPATPLEYCAYDTVYLAADGFAQLKEKQLQALERWVAGGGSVCLLPAGQLKPYHAEFLNKLTARGAEDPAYRLDEQNHLLGLGAANQSVRRFHTGVGQAVIVLRPPEEDALDTPVWRETVAFLWKIRTSHAREIIDDGKWKSPTSLPQVPNQWTGQQWNAYQQQMAQWTAYDSRAAQAVTELVGALAPKDVRLIPFPIIVLILALFVLAIGPVDYFFLGLLKRRRLTWVVFPLVSIGFTLFTVYLSGRYLGHRDYRNAVVFMDIGRDGRVLRQSRYEAIFVAKDNERVTDVENALLSPLDQRQVQNDPNQYSGYSPSTSGITMVGTDAGPRYDGRLPTRYNVHQRIRQWSLQLNRTLTMEPPAQTPPWHWEDMNLSQFSSVDGQRRALQLLLGHAHGSEIVMFFHGTVVETLQGKFETFPESLVRYACAPKAEEMLAVFAQIAPTGGGNLEDLPLLDPTDPNQWLLVVMTQQGDEVRLYRRLYRGD